MELGERLILGLARAFIGDWWRIAACDWVGNDKTSVVKVIRRGKEAISFVEPQSMYVCAEHFRREQREVQVGPA